MTTHDLRFWQHSHDSGTTAEHHAVRRTRWVVGLTFVAMLVELADGWHMASHVGAGNMATY